MSFSLTQWLKEEHHISYKTYRRMSKTKRQDLKNKYEEYRFIEQENESEYAILRECGVPFDEWGDPIGI